MKHFIILIAIVFAACMAYAGQKHKVQYDFPAAMSEAVRAEYTKQCDKGLALYQVNCARCHNTTVKKRDIIPDFAPEQLIGYELRVKNAQHESAMPETTVTAEELSQIMTFLTYKKKNE